MSNSVIMSIHSFIRDAEFSTDSECTGFTGYSPCFMSNFYQIVNFWRLICSFFPAECQCTSTDMPRMISSVGFYECVSAPYLISKFVNGTKSDEGNWVWITRRVQNNKTTTTGWVRQDECVHWLYPSTWIRGFWWETVLQQKNPILRQFFIKWK